MGATLSTVANAVVHHRTRWSAVALSFFILYYFVVLLLTMVRFWEVPNYLEIHDVVGSYRLIFDGTPALSDAVRIAVDEPWIETGFKDPDYYGVATWSYMLVPPKMAVVLIAGMLFATVVALKTEAAGDTCRVPARGDYVAAGIGSGLIGVASVSLTWVVCCATPSWVVALAMLGVSVTLANLLEPMGAVLVLAGIAILVLVILRQVDRLRGVTGQQSTPASAAALRAIQTN